MNITTEHCSNYIRSLDHRDVCGIRGNSWQTLIARVAKFTTGKSQGYAYEGGDILNTPEGPKRLSPQIARIARAFDECRTNDFGAYDVDENGLTMGIYTQLPCGKWYWEYYHSSCMKAYSPDVYRRYYQRPRTRKYNR